MRFSTFTMEWPPKSGRIAEFPEVDLAEWFGLGTARTKILPGQVGFIDALINAVGGAAIVTYAKPAPPMSAAQGRQFQD
jgi:predicted NUDIX family NTP pyrophosphohydrolase